MSEAAETRTYRGNCHCKAFVYEVQSPEITTVTACDCSICTKKCYLGYFPNSETLKVVKGSEDDLATYEFGPRKIIHKFCPTCATPVYGIMPSAAPGTQIALNVSSLQGLNTWDLDIKLYDSSALGDPYQPPEHKGSLPKGEVEGGKIYTGSCHCGALTVAVASKPLDETYKGAVVCNCSICQRNGYIWIYPKASQVVLSGDEANIGRYSIKNPDVAKTFCKKCGVNMTNELGGIPEDQAPEEERGSNERREQLHPVNVRVLHGVDLEKLKAEKLDGWAEIEPPYQNP